MWGVWSGEYGGESVQAGVKTVRTVRTALTEGRETVTLLTEGGTAHVLS